MSSEADTVDLLRVAGHAGRFDGGKRRTRLAKALAVLLGDMPWKRSDTYAKPVAEAHPEQIVLPQPRHPVLLGRQYWQQLCELDGFEGARRTTRRHQANHWRVVNDRCILQDVDRPAYLGERAALASSTDCPARR